MNENLVGYLLNALDPDTHRQVEDHLRDDPGARQHLDHLRRVLEPLAVDAEPPEAPPGLWLRTLAHIAEDRCRRLPPAPQSVTVPAVAASRSWWRRSDLLIAASLLLLAGLVSIPWISELRHREQLTACTENLRRFHTALASYSDLHDGDFPRVEPKPPCNVAGIVVPVLNDARLLNHDISMSCPANGRSRSGVPLSVQELQTLHAHSPKQFDEAARNLSGCYAYSLGYATKDANGEVRHQGLRRDSGDGLPLMADRPPFSPGDLAGGPGNSPNHGSKGQNVLHVGGNVSYLRSRTIPGAAGPDDIYLNNDGRVGAGQGPLDAVLGASWANPYPPESD